MRNILLFVTILTTLVLAGCNNKLATVNVSGTVTLDGEPLPDATVNFSPKVQGQGHPGFAITDANGQYKLQTILGKPDAGTTPGEYEVSFIKVFKPPYVAQASSGASTNTVMRAPERPRSLIPDRYERGSTSGFTATVENKKNNVFDFDLKSQ